MQASRQQSAGAHSALQASKSTRQPSSPHPTHELGMHLPVAEHTVPSQQSAVDVQPSPQHGGGAHCTERHPLGS